MSLTLVTLLSVKGRGRETEIRLLKACFSIYITHLCLSVGSLDVECVCLLVAVLRVPFSARGPAAGDSCQVCGHAAEISGFLGRNCSTYATQVFLNL